MNNDTPEQFFASAIAHYKKGEYGKAIADYTQAIALKPDYADAWCNRGVIYRIMGKEGKALKDFQRANQLDPTLVIQKETENFQAIFEQSEVKFTSSEKRWFWSFIIAAFFTLLLLIGLPILGKLYSYLNLPAVNQYAIYVFCSVVTVIIIRQYADAKKLRIDAGDQLVMAKIFTHVHPENISDYKKFNSSLINAIIYSLHNTQTQNINDSSTFIERIVHKK